MDRIEEYLDSIEELVLSSVSIPELPDIKDAVDRLWLDISRYGPNLPDMRGLGEYPVPPPPPPPEQLPISSRAWDWIQTHPWRSTAIVGGAVGSILLAGYGSAYARAVRARRARISAALSSHKQVVVVLGADCPYGTPLVSDLEAKGYIIIASVSSPEAVNSLENGSRGYVKALVLDPKEPETVPVFLRSLSSCLSRRFPLNAPGDPFAAPSALPYVHSVISLLTLTTPALRAPLEHISLRSAYLPYLSAYHMVPLQIIQALLPLLRSSGTAYGGQKSIIVCLPATDVRVGLPFSSVQSMSAASTLRAVEILRREIKVAALTDKSETMKNIKVVVADIGIFDLGKSHTTHTSPEDAYKAMESWTPSEKVTYGPAFAAVTPLQQSGSKSILPTSHTYGVQRKPSDLSIFVNNIVGVVGNGPFGPSVYGIGLGLGQVRNWIRGERFSIGAGASSYRLASNLPPFILNTILNIPHFLISIRNGLLTTQPFIRPPADVPKPQSAPHSVHEQTSSQPSSEPSEHDSGNEAGSEADVESNASGSGVEGSWVQA